MDMVAERWLRGITIMRRRKIKGDRRSPRGFHKRDLPSGLHRRGSIRHRMQELLAISSELGQE